jgi:hypothetical protein
MLAPICQHGFPAVFRTLLELRWLGPVSFHVEPVKGGMQNGNMR